MMHVYRMGIVGIALALAMVSCGEKVMVQADSPQGETFVHAIGYVEPRERLRRLAFEVPGVISEIKVGMGAEVREGDVLAVLRDAEQAGSLRIAEKRVAVLEAELVLLKAGAHPEAIAAAKASYGAALRNLSFQERERDRLGKLAEVRGVSGSIADEAVNSAELAKLEATRMKALLAALQHQTRNEEIGLAEGRLTEARERLELERVLLNLRKLRAPADGMIVEIYKRAGEMISMGDDDPAILFSPDGQLEVRAEVDEGFWGRFQEGARVKVWVAGGEQVEGKVRLVKRAMGRKTVFSRDARERMDVQVFEAWIALPATANWPVGMEVEVKISGEDEGE